MTRVSVQEIRQSRPRLSEGCEFEALATGCRIKGPMLKRLPPMRWLSKWLRLPERLSVELDDMGTFVVEHLDGRTCDEVISELAKRFRLQRREAEASTLVFLDALAKRRLINLPELLR